RDLDDLLIGYQKLPTEATAPYPSPVERVGNFMIGYMDYAAKKDEEEEFMPIAIDTSARVVEAPSSEDPYQIASNLPKTSVKWEKDTYNFKKIKEGEKVSHSFEVKNTGNNDLHITNVKPSCGCTATYCTKDIIKPGESCSIVIEFNSAGKSGTQQKSITVIGNFEGSMQKVLKFTGEVVNKK
ncbi:MAG: DUF1573 domain-containing protein, partial [Bacteroidales bacterium]